MNPTEDSAVFQAVEDPLSQVITNLIWEEKYRFDRESTPEETFARVVKGVYAKDPSKEEATRALDAMCARDFMPGGRIFAGAGTGKRVTWINCFVSPTIQDSMDTIDVTIQKDQTAKYDLSAMGIMPALNVGAFTQQQGGGIGMCYSTIRPNGALVKRTGSISSGVLPFMNMWNGMCGTIRSSGSRRGAMMATLHIWHPDIIDFINAKTKAGVLTNFNVSVCVTDDFMEALRKDQDWDLGFAVPKADGNHVAIYEKDGAPWYVYQRIKAVDLWQLIIKTTYEFAEPGVIFIDRVNKLNNLKYCETITATNPCGEQPLPPNGDCDLGHINLANMVTEPFTDEAEIDWDRLQNTIEVAVRFLDNVLDTSPFPTQDQYEEAQRKRRIGLGYAGLGNMLQQLMIRYGGNRDCLGIVDSVGEFIANHAYRTSIELAQERGCFPAYDKEEFAKAPFLKKLSDQVRKDLAKYGIRNGVLMSIAPCGTTSIFYGNISSGLEPTFSWQYERDVVVEQKGDEQIKKSFLVEDYGWFLFTRSEAHDPAATSLPDYMVTCLLRTLQQSTHEPTTWG
jgi:ribonucleoside-diphosphate reductase alpha chain